MRKQVFIIMGVSGCGKTSVAQHLACDHNMGLVEGDDLHTLSAKQKMAKGTPLNDVDRVPWLTAIIHYAQKQLETHNCIAISCSSLKKMYRDRLRMIGQYVHFIYLALPQDIAMARVENREQHFFPKDIVQSQYLALQEPQLSERYTKYIDGTQPLDVVCKQASEYVEEQMSTEPHIL